MSLVQRRSAGANPTASLGVTLLSAISSGDMLVTAMRLGGTFSSITDDLGDGVSWTQATTDTGGVRIYYKIAGAAGTPTVTVQQSSARLGVAVYHYDGMDATPLDQQGVNSGTGTAVTSAAITTTTANQAILAAIGSTNAQTWEADYLGETEAVERLATAQRIVSATLTGETADSTQASAAWNIAIASFKESAGGGGDAGGPLIGGGRLIGGGLVIGSRLIR